MNKRIQKLFPKEFYAKDDLNLYAEISLKDLNIIIDYIEKLENYGEAVGERRNELYDKIDKAIKWVNQHISKYNCRGITIIDWDELSNPNDLLEILGDKE